MLDATEALGKIFLVIKLIYTQVQLVKENNEQCNHLVEKIRVIESSVQGLDKIKNKEQYKVGLNDLLGLLQESLDILKNFSDSSFLQQFFLKTGSYQEDFKDLNKKLDSSASQLTFSIVAQLRVNRELKETEEVLPASLPPSIAQVIKSVYKVRPGDLTQFLKLVAEGEQDKAEAMLKKNSELALVPGDLIDLSKRTFIGITAFQYSVWALDWHMWTMIRKYLPDEAAQEQAREFETGAWVKTHGIHANLNILIQAYQTTTDLYNAKKYTEGNTAWVQQVGGAQFLLPTHVINEYCHPTRPFYPLPNFKDSLVLSRSRTIDAGEWFTATYNDGKLGEKFACYRGAGGLVWADCRGPVDGVWAYVRDRDSLCALTSTRTVQREELIAELRPRSAVTNVLKPITSPTPQPLVSVSLTPEDTLQGASPAAAFVPKPNLPEQKNPPHMLTQFKQAAKPTPTVNASDKELQEFLRLVAEGEQDKAEALLQSNPSIALVPGDVTDLSKRTFTGITGFQYAVWALDWHMWTMIRKHLPDDAAREQAQGFETGAWVRSHGVHANLNVLIQAYQTISDLYGASKTAEGNTAWVQQVGGAQRLLPAHVINEYCHPTRPFYPLPNFKDAVALPRTRTISEGEWFTASDSGGQLGEKFACYRGEWGVAWAGCWSLVHPCVGIDDLERDYDCVRVLTSTRTAQREELIAELRPRSVQRKAA